MNERALVQPETSLKEFFSSLLLRVFSVCLITPPSAFLLDERVFVSLGILKVAAMLEMGGHRVNLLDLSGVKNYLEALEDYLKGCTDDAIGITATTPQLPAVIQILAVIRRVRPDLKVILGGPHVTLTYSAVKMELKAGTKGRGHRSAAQLESLFDVLVSGDGELAIFEALKGNVPKVVDGDDPKGSFFLTDEMFSTYPLPARHLVDLKSYHYKIEGFPATSLIAQLGCPFGCGFCGGRNSKSLRLIRNREPALIIAEVKHLHQEYGYTGFMFYDDEMNVSKSFVELMDGLTDLQMDLGVDFRLRGFVKSELFDKAQAEAMFRAGFRWLLCGFEAANERILINIDKRATLLDNTRCVETAKNAGLKIKALMSSGHPGESEASIIDIRDWLIRNQVDDFDCTVITTYPGTPYYDLATFNPELTAREGRNVWTYKHRKTGDCLHAYELDYTAEADYYKGDPNDYKAYVFTDHLSAEQIVRLRKWVEDDVRKTLRIPYNAGAPGVNYEHSMGQGLPASIFRSTGLLVAHPLSA